jgi:hypothetical protein
VALALGKEISLSMNIKKHLDKWKFQVCPDRKVSVVPLTDYCLIRACRVVIGCERANNFAEYASHEDASWPRRSIG